MFTKTALRGVLLCNGWAVLACSPDPDLDAQSSTTSSLVTETRDARPQGPRRPPQAAFDACANLAEDAACKLTLGDRTLDGTCRKGPDGDAALACAPPHPPRHRPPRAAFDACANLAEDAAAAPARAWAQDSDDSITRETLEAELNQLERELDDSASAGAPATSEPVRARP